MSIVNQWKEADSPYDFLQSHFGGYLMCLFCATKKAVSNAYHQFMQRRKRARIYRNMQQSSVNARHTPVVNAGIETYNYKGGKL